MHPNEQRGAHRA